MTRAADTAVFASSDGLARREAQFGTGAERLTPRFGSLAAHTPRRSEICQVILARILSLLSRSQDADEVASAGRLDDLLFALPGPSSSLSTIVSSSSRMANPEGFKGNTAVRI